MNLPTVTLSTPDGTVVCDRCELAVTALARMRGLLGRRELAHGAGMLFRPAGSVHTLFMRFPIDVVFLDGDLNVLKVATNVRPWRMTSCRGAKSVVELPAGECDRRSLREGMRLTAAARA